ncbi:hypothetical protein [Poseidonocella sedimentorum]|uniref:2-keto-4-pentenoate hydratase n=1 Tax=Poseidonocella sedimentorum TaxID=871652 RepID=A0A1I6D7S7_9RHOB|nr:hypothetical protein [Poseidonocella sedimentorum]SFR01510.1 2-keto-4-pentenoate hydratase [Poseidonocella sedimentorum]
MHTTPQAERLANVLRRARRTGAPEDFDAAENISTAEAISYQEALAVQQLMMPDLGAVSGFKVGAFRPGQPALAPIPAERTFESGADIPARGKIGIELEIGFEVLHLPDAQARDMPQTCFRPRIVIELCGQRLAGDDLDPVLKLADMQLNEGLVVGPALQGWDGRDFSTITARLRCGEEVVTSGEAAIPGGSALGNLWTLVDHLGAHCGGLKPGQILITGSVSGLRWFRPEIRVDGHIEGFGPIACRIVPG